jgi:FkbM family methyltransferase
LDVRAKLRAVATTTRLAALVREPVRFWLRVATRRHSVSRYRLRDSDITVHLRHGTVDVITLEQIAAAGHYDPPPQVAALLDAAEAPVRVIDLGANIGMFGAHVRRLYPKSEITAFEPHPANVEVLKRTATANDGGWYVVAACADVADGTVPFWIGGGFTRSRVGEESSETIDVPAVDIFPYLATGDLLKIDIEGAEWKILDDPRFAALDAAAIALEYHAYACPDPDPRAYARRRLEKARYEVADADLAAEPGHGMLWAWRPS